MVLHGDRHGGEGGLDAEQLQGGRERRRVQVAGGDLGGGAGREAPQHFVGAAVAHDAGAQGAHLA